ncbi:hypothetical protein [Streptomyces buecherae]|uniref:hypothetical protein n=1 Tax=Streptomyces buecherae TaxID=2763006 RepID=UPI003F5404C0
MTSASQPPPAGDRPTPSEQTAVAAFRLQMMAISREAETALDLTRDRYGRPIHVRAATTSRTRRDKAAVKAYTTHLAPHADTLLDAARRVLDDLPPTRHLVGWRAVLDDLAASAAEIRETLQQPAEPDSAAERAQHAALWPHLTAWAEHGVIVGTLAESGGHHSAPLPEEEQQRWTEMAQVARRRDELELVESWYGLDGQMITLAHLVEDDDWTLVALRGDPDATDLQVIGHYAHEHQARKALPAPAPPGVLRSNVSRFNRPVPTIEVPLQELIRDVTEGHTAADASEALLSAVRRGYIAGPMVRLQELLRTSGQFASALETVQGRQVAARLSALSRQIEFLTHEVEAATEDLGATAAVLPPHRTPVLRNPPRPPVGTMPPAPPPRSSSPVRHR